MESDKSQETQGKRGVSLKLREQFSYALDKIPISSFPEVPLHKVIEISSNASISETVEILSKYNIFSAPVRNSNADTQANWSERYLGIVDYAGIVFWVLEQAELAAVVLTTSTAAATGIGAGTVGALGAFALGATGPAALAGLTAAAVGAALAGGVAADRKIAKDAPSAADAFGEDFYKLILQEEPFKSTKVAEITKSYRWTPFLPAQTNNSMLTLFLLLSKYRLRSIPVVEMDNPSIKNFITQSAVVKALQQCREYDWFEEIAGRTINDLGLPVMSPAEVIYVNTNQLVLEAFALMHEKQIGGLPVVRGTEKQILGNISLRDIRFLLLKPHLFAERKSLTVIDFLKTVVMIGTDSSPITMIPAVTCTPDTSLGDVIATLSEKGLHRIYVTDDQCHLLGVVTLRDIIACFVSEPEDYLNDRLGYVVKHTLAC